MNYNTAKTIERGRLIMRDKKKFFRKKGTDEEGEEVGWGVLLVGTETLISTSILQLVWCSKVQRSTVQFRSN